MQIADRLTFFAITLKSTGELIGVIGLVVKVESKVPELGILIGSRLFGTRLYERRGYGDD